MSRTFAQYSEEEKLFVLGQAQASARAQLHEERERSAYLERRLGQAEQLLRRAMARRPFRRDTKHFLELSSTFVVDTR